MEMLNSSQVDRAMGLPTAQFAKVLTKQWHYQSCPCRLHSGYLAAYNPGGTLAVVLPAAEAVRAPRLGVLLDERIAGLGCAPVAEHGGQEPGGGALG